MGQLAGEGLLPLSQRIEELDGLDAVIDAVQDLTRPLGRGQLRPLLAGTWLGHSLHPLLTDFPLGFWASASVLDVVGGRTSRPASKRLIALGILASLPTAASGASDWWHVDRRSQRVGLVHAAANTASLVLYTASYLARRRGRTGRGVLLGLAGGVAATAGGFLGGHLTLTAAVTRDNVLLEDTAELPAPR